MGRIKHTKNELKAQREALDRFQRFLPMLQLKKQMLQMETLAIGAELAAKEAEDRRERAGLASWVRLFAEPAGVESLVTLEKVELDEGNVAGVSIPVLRNVAVSAAAPDLFATPPWVDDAVETVARLIRLRVAAEVLREQLRRVREELRVTTQRVNLFEKVKIPESVENIRVIRIFLGDEQTAAVVRGKFAKSRTPARAGAPAAGGGA